MARRSKVITMLPLEIRKELERRMFANRFSDYEGLALWVRQQGYDISDDSLWRYGKRLQDEFEAVRSSLLPVRLLGASAPDHTGQTLQPLIEKVQIIKVLLALAEAKQPNRSDLGRLERAVADLARVYSRARSHAGAASGKERRGRREVEPAPPSGPPRNFARTPAQE
jgi:hypothetical protein